MAQNPSVLHALGNDSISDNTLWYDWMQTHNYSTLIYVGEWDLRDGPAGM